MITIQRSTITSANGDFVKIGRSQTSGILAFTVCCQTSDQANRMVMVTLRDTGRGMKQLMLSLPQSRQQ